MTLPDVNVLIYAFRADSSRHSICKSWLDGIVPGDAQFGISPLTLSAVARIASNPRIFRQPSSVREAFAFCNSLLEQPHCEIVRPGPRHWPIFTRICLEAGIQGAARLRRLVRSAGDRARVRLDHLRSGLCAVSRTRLPGAEPLISYLPLRATAQSSEENRRTFAPRSRPRARSALTRSSSWATLRPACRCSSCRPGYCAWRRSPGRFASS